MVRKICSNCDKSPTCEFRAKRIDGKYPEMECFKPIQKEKVIITKVETKKFR